MSTDRDHLNGSGVFNTLNCTTDSDQFCKLDNSIKRWKNYVLNFRISKTDKFVGLLSVAHLQ